MPLSDLPLYSVRQVVLRYAASIQMRTHVPTVQRNSIRWLNVFKIGLFVVLLSKNPFDGILIPMYDVVESELASMAGRL
jgi:hypothetical protein